VKRSFGRILVIVSTLLTVRFADAEIPSADSTSSEPTQPTVVVVGTTPLPGSELDPNKIPAPVQTASSADIERSHSADLSEFMKRALGSVHINDIQNNPLQADLNYRGYTASPLLGTAQGLSIYLDGVRLNQPFGDVVSWDLIPKNAIASLALMPGSNPVFGLNTLGGAIAIRTKDGFSAPGTEIGLSYGSHRWRSLDLETGGHSTRGFDWYVAGTKLKDDGWRNDSPTEAAQAFAKIGWRGTRSRISLTGAFADTDLAGNALQEQRFLARDYASVYTKPDTTQNRSEFLNLEAVSAITDLWSLSGNAYYRNIRTNTSSGDINADALQENIYQPSAAEQAALAAAGYSGYPTSGEIAANTPFPFWRCVANVLLNTEPNEKCNGILNRTQTSQQEHGLTGQAVLTATLGEHSNQLTLGGAFIESQSHFLQSSQFGYLTPTRGIVAVNGPGAFADGTQNSENAFDARVDLLGRVRTTSLYVTDTLTLANTLDVTLSGRYNRTSVTNRDGIEPDGQSGSLDGNHTFSRFNPAVGATWAITPSFSAYVGYDEGSRTPSAVELGCADPSNPCRLPNSLAGDPPLNQVVTKTMELGVRGGAAAFKWNAGVFDARNYDDILFVADNAAGFGYFKNFGQTRRRGSELGVHLRAGEWTVGANYTYLDATYQSDEIVNGAANSSNDGAAPGFAGNIALHSGDRIPLIPRHILKGGVEWSLGKKVSLSADAIAVSGSLARGNENNRHAPDGVYYLGPGEVGGYAVFNLGAEWQPIESVRLFVQVDNLLDRRYSTAAQLAATGFNGAGNFVARPFAIPVIDGERPLVHATFYAPGAPREFRVGVRYSMH